MARLYIVATPIGNLEDMTFRAVKTLKEVDLILCEDTRMTKRLLDRYEIKKPLLSYHQRSKLTKTEKIIEELEKGKDLALVTDAGTPGISDPGNELVGRILEHFNTKIPLSPPFSKGETGSRIKSGMTYKRDDSQDPSTTPANAGSGRDDNDVEVIPIPGASAVTALASVAGINLNKFVFLGFPPNKKGRETFFKKVLAACYPVVYYESPYRFLKNLELLRELSSQIPLSGKAGAPPLLKGERLKLIVGRELTKIHEEVVRGSISEVIKYFLENQDKIKGEFVVIVH